MNKAKETPTTSIALQNDTQYYTSTLNRSTLAPGVYQMKFVRVGDSYQPGFIPIDVNNDRPLEINNSLNEITNEIEDFFNRRHIFKQMGFSHKRGYIFWGSQGTGKSSYLRLVEEKFVEKFQGLVLIWNNGTGIETFIDAIRENEGPRPVLVVCEDIDSYMNGFEEGILEFLDGQKALDNFVLIATTNNLDKIPSRIKDRPSRIDRVIEIGKPNLETRYQYLRQLGVKEEVSRDLAGRTEGLSIAHLKEVIVATVCLGQALPTVLERLKVADMSPLEIETDQDGYDIPEDNFSDSFLSKVRGPKLK